MKTSFVLRVGIRRKVDKRKGKRPYFFRDQGKAPRRIVLLKVTSRIGKLQKRGNLGTYP